MRGFHRTRVVFFFGCRFCAQRNLHYIYTPPRRKIHSRFEIERVRRSTGTNFSIITPLPSSFPTPGASSGGGRGPALFFLTFDHDGVVLGFLGGLREREAREHQEQQGSRPRHAASARKSHSRWHRTFSNDSRPEPRNGTDSSRRTTQHALSRRVRGPPAL